MLALGTHTDLGHCVSSIQVTELHNTLMYHTIQLRTAHSAFSPSQQILEGLKFQTQLVLFITKTNKLENTRDTNQRTPSIQSSFHTLKNN